MQAIQINFLSPTNTKPARLKASCEGGSIVEHFDYATDIQEQALNLAFRLANKTLNWSVEKFSIGRFNNCYYCNIIA